ncbi:MAG TPA: LLM class F420-dependent oxidoreductase [Chloroflexota bacterium]|nr:LLM class F420-dependent oxidoreductase [Chloroflexota bacterium]
MQTGLVFPQTEISPDPRVVRDYAQRAEELGFTHILAYDHVLGADTRSRPGWTGAYALEDQFHEVFVLFGYLAGLTESIGLVTGVLVLPQRQTGLVAKQAAEVQILSRGRFRLGIGIGWNAVEYEALGEDFSTRGARSAEQIEVLRRLFAEESVTYEGRWHHIEAAGLNPLPEQPIPIWIGGYADRTLRRIARLADGWICARRPDDRTRAMLETLRGYVAEAGRQEQVGVEGIAYYRGDLDELRHQVEGWRELGVEYLSIDAMRAGLQGREHIELLERLREVVGQGVS